MARDPYFDILFEPVKIGPVTTKNRFYQVPHSSGFGYRQPNALAGMRGMRAEGGWGVVNSDYCSIHPTSDDAPYPYARIWDDTDIAAHALMVEKVHEHGALAGIELPGIIASAVFSGHKYAREFDEPDLGDVPFKREGDVLGI